MVNKQKKKKHWQIFILAIFTLYFLNGVLFAHRQCIYLNIKYEYNPYPGICRCLQLKQETLLIHCTCSVNAFLLHNADNRKVTVL